MNITNSLIIFAFSLVINICLTKKDIPYEHALGLFFFGLKNSYQYHIIFKNFNAIMA